MKLNKSVIENNIKFINKIMEKLSNLKSLKLETLDTDKTNLIIIDVINGFVREGALRSERIESIIPPIIRTMKNCKAHGINIIAFRDSHNENSPEFNSYPIHCLNGSSESEIVQEIRNEGGYELINKNSTNGFIEPEFQNYLKKNENITSYIITGDCTDICILQFALSIKTYFNMKNISSRIIVPIDSIETYNTDFHNADLMNVFALEMLDTNGIELVERII